MFFMQVIKIQKSGLLNVGRDDGHIIAKAVFHTTSMKYVVRDALAQMRDCSNCGIEDFFRSSWSYVLRAERNITLGLQQTNGQPTYYDDWGLLNALPISCTRLFAS